MKMLKVTFTQQGDIMKAIDDFEKKVIKQAEDKLKKESASKQKSKFHGIQPYKPMALNPNGQKIKLNKKDTEREKF